MTYQGLQESEDGQELLKLMVMHYPFNPFSSCRIKEHNGKSPLDLAGVDTSRLDWIRYSQTDSHILNALVKQRKIWTITR